MKNIPIIEIVVPSYQRYNKLPVIINSFLAQSASNWKLHIVSDGEDGTTKKLMEPYLKHRNIQYSHIPGPNKDWGHNAREFGLMNSNSDWVVMSGDDNYYVPVFIEEFTKTIQENPNAGFIHCNMVHDHKKYQVIDSQIQEGHIDIGNFMVKTADAKRVGFKDRSYAADFRFIEKYVKETNCEIVKIPKILYVHN